MNKTLYIHIGTHKTGTTALQTFLSTNRELLKRQGVLYPGTRLASHDLGIEMQQKAFSDIMADPKSHARRFLEEIDHSSCQTIILSSESFCLLTPRQISDLKRLFSNRFRIRICVYLRRQDNRLEAGYNQMVRDYRHRLKGTITDLIRLGELDSILFDYYKLLEPWRDEFGKENIIVRCYEKEQMPGEIHADFCEVTGISIDPDLRLPEGRTNESPHWDLVECARLCNTSCGDDLRFQQFIGNTIREINRRYRTDEKRHMLSPEQRLEILTRFAESNARVAREYLERPDGRLFFAPLPDPDEPWTPYEGLTVQQIVPIFFLMMHQMEKRHQKQLKELSDQREAQKKDRA